MPINDLLKGAPKLIDINAGCYLDSRGNVVDRTFRRQLVQEPQRPLTVGEWKFSRSGGDQALRLGCCFYEPRNLSCEFSNAVALQEARDWQEHVEFSLNAVHQLDGGK